MLEFRKQLKEDNEIKAAINNVIFSLKKNHLNMQFMRAYKFDRQGYLQRDAYLYVHEQIALLLRDDLNVDTKIEELDHILAQDWQHDSKG